MSTLIVDELYPGIVVEQPFKITRETNSSEIRLWVYKHNDLVDGTLQVEVLKDSTVLKTFTSNFNQLNSRIPGPYAHGFYSVRSNNLSLRVAEGNTEEEYKLRIQMTGHTKDTDAFLGLVRNYEDKIYPTYGDVVGDEGVNDMIEPFGVTFHEFRFSNRR